MQATLLAYAGLKRLNMADKLTMILEIDDMLPAVAQVFHPFKIRSYQGLAGPGHRHRLVSAFAVLIAVLEPLCVTHCEGHWQSLSVISRVLFRPETSTLDKENPLFRQIMPKLIADDFSLCLPFFWQQLIVQVLLQQES